MSRIFHKFLATGHPVAKNLIIYNNNLEEKDEKEKDPINIELSEQKANSEMVKMLLTLDDQMYKKTRKILFWLISLRASKSKLMRRILQKVTE